MVCLLDGNSVRETLFRFHVVPRVHVEAAPLELERGIVRVPHNQLQREKKQKTPAAEYRNTNQHLVFILKNESIVLYQYLYISSLSGYVVTSVSN